MGSSSVPSEPAKELVRWALELSQKKVRGVITPTGTSSHMGEHKGGGERERFHPNRPLWIQVPQSLNVGSFVRL